MVDEDKKVMMYDDPAEPAGVPLVTVLYSRHGDLFKLPALALNTWMSVQADVPQADGSRKRHVQNSIAVIAGARVALPANDPMVQEYQALAAR